MPSPSPAASPAPLRLRAEARAESFPVASRLLHRRLRPHVVAFYNVVRAGDAIADDPGLSPQEKLARLDALALALREPDPQAPAAVRALAAAPAGRAEALTLLEAFCQDARKARYADQDELLGYCRLSADPVGRFLLRLHGEDPALARLSDALCTALQLLDHLQDLRDDYRRLDRVYLPQAWLAEARCTEAALAERRAIGPLRAVIDRLLDWIDALLAQARALPAGIADRRLRLEAGAVVALALALARRLRREDPLAGRVALGAPAKLAIGLLGAAGIGR